MFMMPRYFHASVKGGWTPREGKRVSECMRQLQKKTLQSNDPLVVQQNLREKKAIRKRCGGGRKKCSSTAFHQGGENRGAHLRCQSPLCRYTRERRIGGK